MEIAVIPSLALFFQGVKWHRMAAACAVTLYAIVRSAAGDMTIAGNLLFGLFLFFRLARLPWDAEWVKVMQACALQAAAVVDTLSTDSDSIVFLFFVMGAGILTMDVVFDLSKMA